MALTPVDLSTVTSALATIFEDQIASQFNRPTVLSRLLPFQEGRGQNITWDAEFGSLPGSSVLADGAAVVDYNNDTVVPAQLAYGTYSEAFSVTGKALAAAAASGNPAELASLFAEKLDRAATRLAANMNIEFYTGSGATDHIMGLTATNGGMKATGTYAGLSRVTYTQWAGNELLNGGVGRALSFQLMRDARKAIYDASGEMPDLIVCDSSQHENYGLLFGQQRRWVDEINLRGGTMKLDGGYKALEFDGIPVIADVHCPAGKMLFLNTRHTYLKQLPHAMQALPDTASAMISLHGTPEEQLGAGPTGFSARINALARTGDAYGFQLVIYPQIQVKRPNACAILGDLL